MRIGIDGKALSSQIGGIGRYATCLLDAILAAADRADSDIDLVVFTAPQTDRPVAERRRVRLSHRFRGLTSSLIRSAVCLPLGARLERLDVVHSLDQGGLPSFLLGHTRYVVTVHDLIPLVMPLAFPPRRRLVLRAALSLIKRNADMVIVPTATTGEDLVQHLGVDPGRIVVIPHGCAPTFRPPGNPDELARVKARYRLPEQYLLFVGTLEPRKNVASLLRAFSALRARSAGPLKLVIAGNAGWGRREIVDTIARLRLGDHVVLTGFVYDHDLPALYGGARLFVYPSLYEGFGLPIVEAMACGTPVVTSKTSAMPEVAGDAAVLVDPAVPEAIADAVDSVLEDEDLRAQLRERGLRRAGAFSWDAAARRTLDVYTTLAARG